MLNKNSWKILPLLLTMTLLLAACNDTGHGHGEHNSGHNNGHDDHGTEAVEKGNHNGRLLRDKDFTLELAIFETGVPPEYRAWAYVDDKPVAVAGVELKVLLTRLGNKIDTIHFKTEGDYLRGDSVIVEPHSFFVTVEATYNGSVHRWEYESLEGRTRIEPAVVEALGIATEIAGPARFHETIEAYGTITHDPARQRDIHARFEGVITAVHVQAGEWVRAGQSLFTVESNESLKPYTIQSPIAGQVTDLQGMTGEQTGGQVLARIFENSVVVADLAIFPSHLGKVKPGTAVTVHYQGQSIATTIDYLATSANPNQSVNARVRLPARLPLGSMVKADVVVDEYDVPLAVKRVGLQGFRDFTVVYTQIGDEFEVRMLELGRTAGEWVEVLGGLEPGSRYVTENSYVIKGDIEKSGASHDH